MNSFIDPTPKRPVDALKFLSFLNLSPITPLLKTFYRNPSKIKHPPQAILKLYALYKLKRFRYLTELWKQLTKKTLRLLGFKHNLSYKTLWHWLNIRVNPEKLQLIHTELIRLINQALAAKGIRMAEQIVGDATQVEAKLQDKQAAYNGHYKMRCYLVHHLICAKTGLTLNWLVAPGNVDEGQFILPLLAKTIVDGFKPKMLIVDNGYAHFFNYEIPNLLGIKLLIGFRKKKNKFSWRGKSRTLRLRFRKMIKAGKLTLQKIAELGLDPDPEKNSLEDVVCALAIAGQHEYAGAYYRNKSLAWFKRDREGWMSVYAPPRSFIEGTHGHQKDWLELDDLVEKGLRKAKLHVALCMLCEASVALTRVQHGYTDSLTSCAYIR